MMDSFVKELHEKIENCVKNNIKEIKVDNLILVWIITFYSCIKHISWSFENEIRCVIAKMHRMLHIWKLFLQQYTLG